MEHIITAKWLTASTWSISFATIFAFTQELQMAITMLSILIMIDFITWLVKSWINKETSSDWMARGFVRKSTLILIPITLMLIWQGVNINLTTFTTWTMWALIFSEWYSVIGNIYNINTWKKIKEYDVLTIIIKKLSKIIDAFLVDKKD